MTWCVSDRVVCAAEGRRRHHQQRQPRERSLAGDGCSSLTRPLCACFASHQQKQDFFEEIEDLKYQYQTSVAKLRKYEARHGAI